MTQIPQIFLYIYPLSSSPPPANSISAGQLLCGGLFSADSLSNWCAAVALAHALQDNLTQKEQLLRVQLATSLGKPPVSLLQQCTNILSQVGRPYGGGCLRHRRRVPLTNEQNRTV